MSTAVNIVRAVEVAERHMTDNGYPYGPCLGAKIIGPLHLWEVEFAYEGLLDRSPTTDPGSILLAVNLKTESVEPLEM